MKNNNFMDKNSFIAIFLITIAWLVWSVHLQKKYPNQKKDSTQIHQEKSLDASTQKISSDLSGTASEQKIQQPPISQKKEQKIPISTSWFDLEINSSGMSLRNIVLKKYTDKKNRPIQLGKGGILNTGINFDKDVTFHITQESPNYYVGVYDTAGYRVQKSYLFHPDKPFVDVDLSIQIRDKNNLKIQHILSEQILPEDPDTNFLKKMTSMRSRQRAVIVSHKDSYDDELSSIENKQFISAQFSALNTSYFTLSLEDRSNITPEAALKKINDQVSVEWSYEIWGNIQKPPILKSRLFIGPQDLDLLNSAGDRFYHAQDLGFFGFIGRYFLLLLKIFNSFLNNWGLSIIALTLLLRMLLLPLNLKSISSMQSMQKIQPEIKKIKEQYKDDPQRLNQEVMLLMKQHKANPLGGCLFMLFQLPIFFALYRVLDSSVDFYKAPFVGWLQDLSQPDPYFILPVLMILTMLGQQKLTVHSMPKEQAKMMKFVVIIFGLFMIYLPSGLCLYILVSTLFGLVQQVLVNKNIVTKG